MTVPQLSVLLAAGLCFVSHAWGLVRFFWIPSGPEGRSSHIIERATAATILLHAVALLWFRDPAPWGTWSALALYAVSLVLFWWCVRINRAQPLSLAFSTDRPDHLVTRGPYAWVRHPFYLSYLLCWLAGVAATGQWLLLATVLAMGWIYRRAALAEEAKFAASPLAEAYRQYMTRAGRFVPTPWRRQGGP
ncbi:MAG: isoprenylcysteine carboxylmethyltransferase family protein [Rhodospirillales bacterium]|nr:isoprenylcysteine carboxylmethyltransferase family protein [Rhodospirillales bacterium]